MVTFRKVVFADQEIYHVYNRGVEKRPIFTSKKEYERMIETARFYQFSKASMRLSYYLLLSKEERLNFMKQLAEKSKKEVSILVYCLMPNHFHFLLIQLGETGISRFTANITNSYTKYFNTKHKRVGPLVQGTFKAVRVETDEQLIHLSRYIHLNPVTSYLLELRKLDSYLWSSYSEYLGIKSFGLCDTSYVKNHFSTTEAYKQFVYDQADHARVLENIKHVSFDEK